MCSRESEVMEVASEVYLHVGKYLKIENHLKECASCMQAFEETKTMADKELQQLLKTHPNSQLSFAAANTQ